MSELLDRMEHPDAELLGSFVEGTLDADRTAAIAAHLGSCNECLDAVGAAARAMREEQIASSAKPWWSRKTFSIAAAAALIMLVGLATFRQVLRSETSLDRLVNAAPRDYRLIEPRLTGFRWAAMRTPYRDASPSLSTADPDFLEMAVAAGEALRRARKSEKSADAVHAAGVGQLLLREPASATSWLEKATALERDNAHTWSDLAAAQLARATQEQRPTDLLLALASADAALRIDPRLPEARFNRALILETMQLRDEAATAWRAYLEVDGTSPWAGEAREHLERLADGSGR
jgi:tetratricopeptide (TPR) repeat protein